MFILKFSKKWFFNLFVGASFLSLGVPCLGFEEHNMLDVSFEMPIDFEIIEEATLEEALSPLVEDFYESFMFLRGPLESFVSVQEFQDTIKTPFDASRRWSEIKDLKYGIGERVEEAKEELVLEKYPEDFHEIFSKLVTLYAEQYTITLNETLVYGRFSYYVREEEEIVMSVDKKVEEEPEEMLYIILLRPKADSEETNGLAILFLRKFY